MCGIAFVINYGRKHLDIDYVYDIFDMLNVRGTDASGMYFERVEDNRIAKRTIKVPLGSDELIKQLQGYKKEDEMSKFALNGKEYFIMFHCRQKTRGSEYNNANNMPIFSKNYLLIHNGVISNAKIPEYPYKAEVDSEEILANVETYGILEGIKKCNGSMAIILKPIKERRIYVYRNTNPMDFVYSLNSDVLIGCSNGAYALPDFQYADITNNLIRPKTSLITVPAYQLMTISFKKPEIKLLADLTVKTTIIGDVDHNEGYNG